MKRAALELWAVCVLCLPGTVSAAVLHKTVGDLAVEAQKIVIGDVEEVVSSWDDVRGLIMSRVVVHIDDYLVVPEKLRKAYICSGFRQIRGAENAR